MPESPIDLTKLVGSWQFERSGPGGINRSFAQARVHRGVLIITVSNEDTVSLSLAVHPEGEVVRGKAVVGEGREDEVDVELQIKEGGRRMKAIPSGYANLEEWDFKRPGGAYP